MCGIAGPVSSALRNGEAVGDGEAIVRDLRHLKSDESGESQTEVEGRRAFGGHAQLIISGLSVASSGRRLHRNGVQRRDPGRSGDAPQGPVGRAHD